MRTAIFVYETANITIDTSESNLELACMYSSPVPLTTGAATYSIAPGIYKIISSQDVQVTGDASAFDLIATTDNKDNVPEPPPKKVTEVFSTVTTTALQNFFAIADAKVVSSP